MNGWANYETWATQLYLFNTEGEYRYAMDMLLVGLGREGLAITLKADAPYVEITDMRGHDYRKVDWLEIADAFIEAAEQ